MFDPPLFAKYKVEEHNLFKDWFFDEFQYWLDDNKKVDGNMWNTDFRIDRDKRPYTKLANKFLGPYIEDFAKKWNAKIIPEKGRGSFDITWWFAEYEENDDHQWHIHPGSLFGAVYMLELPDPRLATELDGKDLKAEEGDLIIFPAQWPHRSPVNKDISNKKTVLAANIFWDSLDHPKYEVR